MRIAVGPQCWLCETPVPAGHGAWMEMTWPNEIRQTVGLDPWTWTKRELLCGDCVDKLNRVMVARRLRGRA